MDLKYFIYAKGNECVTAWKVSKYGVFSGPYFPVFSVDTEIYWLK